MSGEAARSTRDRIDASPLFELSGLASAEINGTTYNSFSEFQGCFKNEQCCPHAGEELFDDELEAQAPFSEETKAFECLPCAQDEASSVSLSRQEKDMLVCVCNAGTQAIGHGIAAYRDLAHPGCQAILKVMAERKIAFEVCPYSNNLVGSTKTAELDLHRNVKQVIDDYNVPVVFGTDDATLWAPGNAGESMRWIAKYMMQKGFTPDDIKQAARESCERLVKEEKAKEYFLRRIRECPADNIAQECPMFDMHAHFYCSLPRDFAEEIYRAKSVKSDGSLAPNAQKILANGLPPMRQFDQTTQLPADKAQVWPNLKAFAKETYAVNQGNFMSAGLNAYVDAIEAIAKNGVTHKVYGVQMQIGAPTGNMEPWNAYFGDMLLIARAKARAHGFFVRYISAYVRVAPVGAAVPVRNRATQANGRASRLAGREELHWLFACLATPEIADELKTLPVECPISVQPARIPALISVLDVLYWIYHCASEHVMTIDANGPRVDLDMLASDVNETCHRMIEGAQQTLPFLTGPAAQFKCEADAELENYPIQKLDGIWRNVDLSNCTNPIGPHGQETKLFLKEFHPLDDGSFAHPIAKAVVDSVKQESQSAVEKAFDLHMRHFDQ